MTITRVAAASVLMAVCAIAPSSNAWAHTEIESSTPQDQAVLKQAPRQVVLTFSEAPLDTGLAVVSQGPQGRTQLPAQVRGNDVVAVWPKESSAGPYVVSYRVVADDGHPITGQLSFQIAEAKGTPASSSSANSTPVPAAQAPVQGPTQSTPPYWLWALVALLIIAALYALVTRSRRHRD